jgi:hypothetical protein
LEVLNLFQWSHYRCCTTRIDWNFLLLYSLPESSKAAHCGPARLFYHTKVTAILGEHLATATENTLPASIMHDDKAALYLETLSTTAALGTSMSSLRRRAHFETTKRVLAAAVNERLAIGTIETFAGTSLLLRAPNSQAISGDDDTWIKCGIRAGAYFEKDGLRIIGFLRAEDLLTPVLTGSTTREASEELDPTVLARIICRWNPELASDNGDLLIKELRNATDNQSKFSSFC